MINFFKPKNKKEPKNFKDILACIEKLENKIGELSGRLEETRKMTEASLQKFGLVRYNPFSDMGGDQSFSIALLDSKDNGFIITSLHSREGTRVYAKPVKNGESEYQLSEEEMEVIEKARS